MCKTLSLVAVAGAIWTAGSAQAFLGGERVHVGAFSLGGGQVFTWSYLNVPNNDSIVALTFEIDYIDSDLSYASDLKVLVSTPTGGFYDIGGYDFPGPIPWAFQGFVSDPSGFYVDKVYLNPWEPKGWWTFEFINDWAADTDHNFYNIWVTFQKIPAPGSLALLGMGGFAVARRRR